MGKIFDDLRVSPGDHIIAVLTEESDIEVAAQYISEGVSRADSCSVIALPEDHPALSHRIETLGVDLQARLDAGKFTLLDPEPIALENGRFNPERFLESVEETSRTLKSANQKHALNCGLMRWLSENASVEDILYFEARFNQVVEDSPISGL